MLRDDTQTYYIEGSSTTVPIYREGANTRLLKARINDSDRNDLGLGGGVKGAFRMMTNFTNDTYPGAFIFINMTTTDADGNLSYTFDPNCTFSVGLLKMVCGFLQ